MLGLRGCRLGIRHPGELGNRPLQGQHSTVVADRLAGRQAGSLAGGRTQVAGCRTALHRLPRSFCESRISPLLSPALPACLAADITEMQAKAILEAAVNVSKRGIRAHPHIMVPLVGFEEELAHQVGGRRSRGCVSVCAWGLGSCNHRCLPATPRLGPPSTAACRNLELVTAAGQGGARGGRRGVCGRRGQRGVPGWDND